MRIGQLVLEDVSASDILRGSLSDISKEIARIKRDHKKFKNEIKLDLYDNYDGCYYENDKPYPYVKFYVDTRFYQTICTVVKIEGKGFYSVKVYVTIPQTGDKEYIIKREYIRGFKDAEVVPGISFPATVNLEETEDKYIQFHDINQKYGKLEIDELKK